jgi:hypothetical protein
MPERHGGHASAILAPMRELEELLAAWRANPDADATVDLCATIGTSGRDSLAREVGIEVEARHANDSRVMLALGRMFLDAGLLAESQHALVTAGKGDARDPAPFRWLGEVLLRRGDAARAKRVLERAIELGQDDPDTRLARDRAEVLLPLQERRGMKAVASEVERTLARARSEIAPSWPDLEAPTVPRDAPAVVQHAAPWLYSGPVPITLPRVAPRVNYGSVDTDVTPVMRRPRVAARPAPFDGSPGAILRELAAVGLFEQEPVTRMTWEAPPRGRGHGAWIVWLAAVVAVGSGAAASTHADRVRNERAVLGRELAEQVTRLLDSGRMEDLEAGDRLLARVFELDSSNRRAASLWVDSRIIDVLLRPDTASGLESAIARAADLGASQPELIPGRIASRLASDELTGAVELIRQWDPVLKQNAMYQLVSGAVLERAGDRRALARYQAALTLDPGLWTAELLRATLALFEDGPGAGGPLVAAATRHLGDQPVTRALAALLWVMEGDPKRPLPANAVIGDDTRSKLPQPLAVVPHMVRALEGIGTGDVGLVRKAILEGLTAASSPAAAVALGRLARRASDEALAGRAARVALRHSPAHPDALWLAARWAVVSGSPEQALSAARLLEPPARDAVGALAAYEASDPAALARASESLGSVSPPPELRGVLAGQRILGGHTPLSPGELGDLTALEWPWADLWAVDLALCAGDLPKAIELVASWQSAIRKYAPGLLREAQLERYRGHGDQAAKLTARAAELGSPTPRLVVERVFALAEVREAKAALGFAEKNTARLGPLGAWLVVFAKARAGLLDQARSQAADLTPPNEGSVLLRVAAARGLAAARDRRAPGYLTNQLRVLRGHPDLMSAAAEYQRGVNGS